MLLASRPETPLRVLCIAAFEFLARLQRRTLGKQRRQAMALACDFGSLCDDFYDHRRLDHAQYRALRRELRRIAPVTATSAYVRQLRCAERRRPVLVPGDPNIASAVAAYRSQVLELSLRWMQEISGLNLQPAMFRALLSLVSLIQLADDLLDWRDDQARGIPSHVTASILHRPSNAVAPALRPVADAFLRRVASTANRDAAAVPFAAAAVLTWALVVALLKVRFSQSMLPMTLLRTGLQNFEIGARRPLLVRRECVSQIGVGQRILFVSDLHLRKNGPRHIVDQLAAIAASERPNVILLGGDLVDSGRGIGALQALVRRLVRVAPVGAVSGNHDHWLGLSKVRAAVLAGGGRWLEDAPWLLTPACAIYGSDAQPAQSASRHLLCVHHPAAPSPRFDLTLSGHLHGGQFIFFERGGRLYPGALLYRWNGLRFDHNDGKTLLISRGVQDTFPLRWNCPREVLVVDI